MAERTVCEQLAETVGAGESKIVPAIFEELTDETYRERALSAHLRVAPVFKGLSDAQLRALRKYVEMLDLDEGEVVARGGQPADALYLVRSGAIKCVGRDHLGREKILGYYMDNSSFGERALTAETRAWPGNYVALAPTAVLKLARGIVSSIFGEESDAVTLIARAADFIVAEEEGAASGIYEVDWTEDTDFTSDQLEVMVGKQSVKGGEALVIDLNRCVRCNACVESCVAVHEDRVPRLHHRGLGGGNAGQFQREVRLDRGAYVARSAMVDVPRAVFELHRQDAIGQLADLLAVSLRIEEVQKQDVV